MDDVCGKKQQDESVEMLLLKSEVVTLDDGINNKSL